MSGIFKAYDIRGVYPVDLDAAMAEAIGRAYIEFTGAKKVVVGRDMRPHSEPLFQALAKGMVAQGAEVIDIGMCSTPQSYFANGTLKAEAVRELTGRLLRESGVATLVEMDSLPGTPMPGSVATDL